MEPGPGKDQSTTVLLGKEIATDMLQTSYNLEMVTQLRFTLVVSFVSAPQ